MNSGVKIPSYKPTVINNKIIEELKPELVYIPLVVWGDSDITLLVKNGDYVYKGEVIARKKGNFRMPIHASVSGVVLSIEEKPYLNGEVVKCVAIKNDFLEKEKEEQETKKKINEYSKEEFITNIREAGIVGLGGAGFPAFVKYDTKEKIKTLIINAVECEPYIISDYMLFYEKCEEILEVIDAIIEINDINEAIVVIDRSYGKLKEKINTFRGTYLKIKLVEVPSRYPMGWERALIKKVKGITYNKYPIEKGIIVNNLSTIYAIYETLKYNKPMIERVVTISGDYIDDPYCALVKVGTPLKTILKEPIAKENICIIAGGPMMGVGVISDELVVSPNLSGVLLSESKKEIIEKCIRCGKCIDVCPVKLSPVLIMDNIDNLNMLEKLEPGRCINCGLCSYICPARIKLKEIVGRATKIIKEVEK